jgi:hypothetical protein
VWWLTDAYQPWQHAGEWNRWCCTAGCGTTWAGVDDYRREHRAKKKIRETLDNGLHPA